jgi:hypothetical protein
MLIRYIKNIAGYSLLLSTGRQDIPTISVTTKDTILADTLIVSDVNSPNYNSTLIDSYIRTGILTMYTVNVPSNTFDGFTNLSITII